MSPPPGGPLRRPQTLGGVVYLALTAVAIGGVVLAVASDWRTGVSVVGGCLIVGALFRVVLNDHDAGMLRVRRAWFDIALMLAVGAVLIFLSATIPDQPGV